MKKPPNRSRRDPTISLINIVFLILIFFMVSSTLAASPNPAISFVQTDGLECCASESALEVSSEGGLYVQGEPIASAQAYLDALPPDQGRVQLLPDQDLPARDLLLLVSELRNAGAETITIVTENQR